MLKRKRSHLILIGVVALVLVFFGMVRPVRRGFFPRQKTDVRSVPNADVTETESRSILGGLTRLERTSVLENGDRVVFGRVSTKNSTADYHVVYSETFQSDSGTVWYYDDRLQDWNEKPLSSLVVGTRCVYIDGDDRDYFIYVPNGYEVLENNSLRETGSRGYIVIERTLGKWRLNVVGPVLNSTDVGDYTIVSSDAGEPLLDASDKKVMNRWANYCHENVGLWCYDGYYYPAASTYIPSGPGVHFRCVAAYYPKSLSWQVEIVRCAADMIPAILDTLRLQQNEEGYFPSMSGSTWLNEDYGITPGYYDTRFNSGLMLMYYDYMKVHGGFEEMANRYFDFYLQFAEEHHYETANGGWLIWDYNNSTSPVHCALNHQLAEIRVLYRFSPLLERPELEELADRMLLAIEDTQDDWIMEDSNLEYAYMADGSYGLTDYPYLTYNDMYYLQRELLANGRERNKTLDILMEAKLQWMNEHGITGFETAPIS